jgi:hypothetical protein
MKRPSTSGAARQLRRFVLLAHLLATSSCDPDAATAPEVFEAVGDARALGLWAPQGSDTCSPEVHDGYATVAPDGLRYPTWHPAVDPATGCTFGHEHGRDPSGSDLFALVGPIPFGYANEHLVQSGFPDHRHEDHVGHKVEWENNMSMRVGDGGSAALAVECDVLTKLHQGTHSPDAFTNNMHEVAYHIRCSDGTGFSATLLTPIGKPGEMVVGCDRERHIQVGTATPPSSPAGGGKRALPDVSCVQQHLFQADGSRPRFDSALRESWEISGSLRAAGGRTLVSFNPYFQVMDPSRFFDPSGERQMGRPIDLCFTEGLRGQDRCEGLPTESISWDDPRSPFKGVRRFVDINGNSVKNAAGPEIWYTDPLGRNGSPRPFPGSIRQWIAIRNNNGLDLSGPVIGKNRDYDAPGVHAPN